MRAYTLVNGKCTPGLPECFCAPPNTNIRIQTRNPRISTETALAMTNPTQETLMYGLPIITPIGPLNDNSPLLALAFNPNEYRPASKVLVLVDYRTPYLLVLSAPSGPILLSKDRAFTITADAQLQAMPTEKPREKFGYEIL